MQLVYTIGVLVAVIHRIACQGPIVAAGAGQNLPSDIVLSAIVERIEPVVGSSLPDGRLPPTDGTNAPANAAILSIDRNISPAGRTVPLPDGRIISADRRLSATERRVAPVDGSVLLSNEGISPVDQKIIAADTPIDGTVLLPDRGILPADRRLLEAGQRISPVDGNVLMPDANISPIDQKSSQVDPPIDGSVLLSDRGILPVDRRLSAVERRISQVDGNVLMPKANISPVDQKISQVNPPIDGSVFLPDRGILPVDRRLSAVERRISQVDGNVLMPKANISPVDQKISQVDPPIDGSVLLSDRGILPVDRRLSAVERRISPFDGNVLMPNAKLSPVDQKISAVDPPIDGSVSLPEWRILPVDRRLSAVERRISTVDRSFSLPDGRLSGVDLSGSLPGGSITPVDRSGSPSGGRITSVDLSGLLPGESITPVDRSGSLTDGRIAPVDLSGSLSGGRTAPVDGGILGLDGNISPIGGRTSTIDGRLSPIDRIFSPVPDDPMFVHEECVKAACAYPSLCYIPHPRDCFQFIMCKPLETGQVIAQAMPCAFGTKWNPGSETACERFDLVDCPNDKCRYGRVTAYKHDDWNCRTYWKCVNGRSRPACCGKYHSFDPRTNQCVGDIGCDSECPLLNDATCRSPGVMYANFADGNCLTHWDCENGHQHPVCCPSGQGFDVFRSTCVRDPSCTHRCPKEYSESCSIPGTKSYDLVDDNCRTYIKCNKYGQSDPYCCLPGSMYDVKRRKCVPGLGRKCLRSNCPYGYLEECNLEKVPGNPRVYKNLDAFGGTVMPCPVGTIFNTTGCQCSDDAKAPEPSPTPNHCAMAIEAIFPNLKNMGTAVAALLMIGAYGQGERGVGDMINFWDGGAGINIPFYGSQSLHKLYLEARFRPTAGSYNKQVFTSSCNYVGGVPTFEVSLDQFQGPGGIIKVLARTDGVPGLAEMSLPYNFNDEIMLRVMYDGTKIGLFTESSNPTMSNSAVRPLSGLIPIHRSGLRFAHCRYENNVSGFIGYVSKIKFSKCLTSKMQGALDAAAPVV